MTNANYFLFLKTGIGLPARTLNKKYSTKSVTVRMFTRLHVSATLVGTVWNSLTRRQYLYVINHCPLTVSDLVFKLEMFCWRDLCFEQNIAICRQLTDVTKYTMDSQQHMRSTQHAPSSTVVNVNTIQLHLLDSRQHYKFWSQFKYCIIVVVIVLGRYGTMRLFSLFEAQCKK